MPPGTHNAFGTSKPSSTQQRSPTKPSQAKPSSQKSPSGGSTGRPGGGNDSGSSSLGGRSSQSDPSRSNASGGRGGGGLSSASKRDSGGGATRAITRTGSSPESSFMNGGPNAPSFLSSALDGVASRAAEAAGLSTPIKGGFSPIGMGTAHVGDLAAVQAQAQNAVQNFLGRLKAEKFPSKSLTNANVKASAAIRNINREEFIDELSRDPVIGKYAAAVAGIAGRAVAESTWDVTAVNPDDPGPRGSVGVLQWNSNIPKGGTTSRLEDLENFAKANDLDPNEPRTQARFVAFELKGKEKAAWEKIKAAGTAEEAARLVGKHYIRPDDDPRHPGEKLGERTAVSAAKEYYSDISNRIANRESLAKGVAATDRMFGVALDRVKPGMNYTPINNYNSVRGSTSLSINDSINDLMKEAKGLGTSTVGASTTGAKKGLDSATSANVVGLGTGPKKVKVTDVDVALEEIKANKGVDPVNIPVGEFFGQGTRGIKDTKIIGWGDLNDVAKAWNKALSDEPPTFEEKEAAYGDFLAEKAASPDPVDRIMAAAFGTISKRLGGGIPGDASMGPEAQRKRSHDSGSDRKRAAARKSTSKSTPKEEKEEEVPINAMFLEAIKRMGEAAVRGAQRPIEV